MPEETNIWKKIILEILDFLRYKVENDKLTLGEAESIARTIESNLELSGTIDDLSAFYGQSRTNVSSVINRRMARKPTRRVFYSFMAFRKIIPNKWRCHRQPPDCQRDGGKA